MAMALSMVAMMAPSAAPFFVAYGRDRRRPIPIVAVVLGYLVAWAAIGLAADGLMNRVMLPAGPVVIAAGLGFAALYALMPWSRWARSRCRAMCATEARSGVLSDAARYTGCCVLCSAGLMAALMVIGTTNLVVVAAGATAMAVYKLI